MLFLKKSLRLILLLLVLLPIKSIASPGAWLLPKGEGKLISNFNYYRASEFTGSSGAKSATELFEKYEINPYLEYGYSDDLTIGGSFAAYNTYNYSVSDKANYKIDHFMIFARPYLFNEGSFVISAEPSFAYNLEAEGDLNPEKENYATQMKINFGYGEEYYFLEAAAAYMLKSGGADDKIKADAAIGFKYDDFIWLNQLLAEHIAGTDYSNPGNYDLYKAQTSLIWDQDEELSHQIGFAYDISGKNTGLGYGIIYSVWYKF